MTTPESYGALSHLCASVAHESASSTPSEVLASGRCRRPQAERAVNVDPAAALADAGDDAREGIGRARRDVARLEEYESERVGVGGEGVGVDRAARVNGDPLDRAGAEARHS